MTKWTKVLVAGFMTLALLFLCLVPLIYKEPFRMVHVIFVGLFFGSAYWLVRTIRTPDESAESEIGATDGEVVPPGKTSLILLGVLAIIPWAFVWVIFLSPLFGLQNLPIKGHLIFVLGIPAAVVGIFTMFRRNAV